MSVGERPDGSSERRWNALLAIYSVCYLRYQSNTALQWQALAYVLAAQGVLLGGVFSTRGVTSEALGVASLLFGSLGVILMQRIELTAWWDRERLDTFEKMLLPDDPNLRLLHDMNLVKRLIAQPSPSQAKRLETWIRRVEYGVIRRAHPSVVGLALVFMIGALSMFVAFAK